MKWFQNFSIKNKLTVIMLTVALLSMAVGFTFIIISNIKTFTKEMLENTHIIANYTADACATPIAFNQPDEVKSAIEPIRSVAYIESAYVYQLDTKDLLWKWDRKENPNFITPFISEWQNGQRDLKNEVVFIGEYLHAFKPLYSTMNLGAKAPVDAEIVGWLYIRASRAPLDKKISEYLRNMSLVGIGLIVITYFLAVRFQRVISEPILNLASVTEKIRITSDYSVRVKKEGKDEIGILYFGFNNMLEQLQVREKQRDEAMEEQKRLMAELEEKNKELEQVVYVTSHDLRSPLVNIQGFSKELDFSIKELGEMLNSGDIPQELRTQFDYILQEDIPDSLKYILSSTSKMDALLSGLLKLSRVGRTATTLNNIDMNELFTEISNAFEFHFKEGNVAFSVGPLPPCYGNDVQINQMFSNLVSNALKYRDPNRTPVISVKGWEEQDRAIYCVEDNGLGIAKEHQKKIFEIFHRLNPGDSQGEGLGLTIVNKIIGRHNGKIWVESEPGAGSKFIISLPKPRASAPPVNTTSDSVSKNS